LGGYLFARLGRMPTLLVGAALPIFGNLLYAELAAGGANIDIFAHFSGLSALANSLGTDDRMVRLMLAISGENIAAGVAGAAFVAYLSGIVSKQFTAVQYALLSSLTFLIGSLGRGIAGEAFDTYGYATVFHYTAAVGGLAVIFVLIEWARTVRVERLVAQSGS
jgi:MFS transporter, PAT family, beta-lactamase induction signal transducer AmpG